MDFFVYLLYRAFAAALAALPLDFVFRLGKGLGTMAYFFAVPYRKLVLRNLHIAYSGEKSPDDLRRLAREHFATLGANLLSSLKLATMPREQIQDRVALENLDVVNYPQEKGHGFVFVVSHLGNWELNSQLSPLIFKCKVGTIYQRLGNRFIDADVRKSRARLGLDTFERKEGFDRATRLLREGGGVGVLVDQHAGDKGVWTPLFGRLASTSPLAATLALRTGAALIPAAIYTTGVARWRFVLGDPIPTRGLDSEQITAKINGTLEQQIRVSPQDWFWVHDRWKTPEPKFLLADYKRGVTLPENLTTSQLKPFRILLRSTNWLGDAVMTVPAVRAIKRGRPDAHVSVLTQAKLVDFWKTVAEVDEVLAIGAGEGVFAVAKKIRRGNFDAAILFPNSLRSALEAWLARVPRRIGYAGHGRKYLLNQILHREEPPGPPRHQVHHYLDLAEFIGAKTAASFEPSTFDPRPSTLKIGLCPGAEYGPAKRWLPERFAEVAKTVSAKIACEWVLFGVEKDREIGEQISAALDGKCVNLIGKTSLAELIGKLRECRALLTNDTGTMHLAAHLGVPVVAIFGSTEPALTGPLGKNAQVIRHHVACSPCFLRECPLDFRCMKAVSVEEVVAVVLQMSAPL